MSPNYDEKDLNAVLARMDDTANGPVRRKSTNIWQHIETGIPGFRQTVPRQLPQRQP